MRHPPCGSLGRHRHREAFAAVVLAGGYVEAGDTGRHRVGAGDVVLHGACESHLDRFDPRGADVLVLPLPPGWCGGALGTVSDPDLLARLAERDVELALAGLAEALRPAASVALDWPDLLAEALRSDPNLSLSEWADHMGLHVGSLSRGFHKLYGVTPAAYRLVQRTHRALEALRTTDTPLSAVAQACGFADQAHMCRAVTSLAETSPARLRRAVRQAATPAA
jgi:AraC-like DNA-binding protein